MYKKILVPLDGSHRSMAAATHAVQIASKLNSKITFFHVVPNITPYGSKSGEHPGAAFKAISREFEAMGESILNDAENEFKEANVTIEKKLAWGKPEQEICDEAKEGQCDLIVIGSRGLGEIKGYLMGSVSNRVSRHAPCPVLIVR
jgi:nucleotide-binding universal stress UspA family protein